MNDDNYFGILVKQVIAECMKIGAFTILIYQIIPMQDMKMRLGISICVGFFASIFMDILSTLNWFRNVLSQGINYESSEKDLPDEHADEQCACSMLCACGKPATHKIEELPINKGTDMQCKHTIYLCDEHFDALMELNNNHHDEK